MNKVKALLAISVYFQLSVCKNILSHKKEVILNTTLNIKKSACLKEVLEK